MKKHLIAAAVAAVVTVPAAAQVTVYGLIGYEVQKSDTQAGRKDTAVSTSTSLGSPVIGFRGSEDLGDGMKAEFNLESDINMGTGSADGTTNLFSRQTWVGISGGFGSIRVGQQNNAIKDIDGFGETGANLFDVDAGLANRDRRTVKYMSPTFAGFSATISNSPDVATTQTANTSGVASSASATHEVNAVNAQYSQGKLKVAYGQATSLQSGFKISDDVFGASYDFGVAALDASIQKQDRSTSANGGKVDILQVGANIPLGKTTIKLNYQDHDYNGTSTADTRYFGVMGVYNFSKRTNAFLGWRGESGKDNADVDVALIGINHSF